MNTEVGLISNTQRETSNFQLFPIDKSLWIKYDKGQKLVWLQPGEGREH